MGVGFYFGGRSRAFEVGRGVSVGRARVGIDGPCGV